MAEFVFRPSPDQRVAKAAMAGAFLLAFVALLLHMLQFQPLLADLLFLIAAGSGIFIWTRYILSDYTYSLFADGIFEVKRAQGRKVTVFCSIPLYEASLIEKRLRTELPKNTCFATKSMLPKHVLLLTVLTDKGEEAIALEYDEDLYRALLSSYSMWKEKADTTEA